MSSPLRLRAFGGLAIERDGSPVSGAGAQRRPLALLALLAAAGERGISRAKLVGLLWPESDEEKARRVLAQTLYSLRRDLGSDYLITGSTELRLNPEIVGVDLWDFEAAVTRTDRAAAAAMYAGPFLDGFYVPGAPDFERWMDETRSALSHRYIELLERLVEESAKAGERAKEVAWCRKLAAAEPLSARHAIRLMKALARAGDRAGALQHARVHEALMRAELDAAPDPTVMTLAEQLRVQPVVIAPSLTISLPAPVKSATPAASVPSVREPASSPAAASTEAPPSLTTSHSGTAKYATRSAEVEAVSATQEWMLHLMTRGSGVARAPATVSRGQSTAPERREHLPHPSQSNGAAHDARPPARRSGRAALRWSLIGAVVLVAAAVTYFKWPRATAPAGRPVIAIAGVATLTPDTAVTWLAQALPQLLATKLMRSPEIEVAPVLQVREVMLRAGLGGSASAPSLNALRDIAARVGATVVVSGQIARDGDAYVFHVASYDARSGRTLRMSEVVNTNALDLADAAATQILEAAGQSGSGPSIADIETPNVDAYRAYLRAHQALDEARSVEYMRNLDLAISLDSGFLAAVQERLAQASIATDDATVAKLKPLFARYATRATEWVRMTQAADEAHYNGEPTRALSLAQQLVARYPRDPRAYSYLLGLHMSYGRFSDAERVASAALALDSLGMEAGSGPCVPCTGYRGLTDARIATGDLEGAARAARRWTVLQPDVPGSWLNLAKIEIVRQRFDSALAALRRAQVLAGGGDEYWDTSVRTMVMSRRYRDADTAIAHALETSRKPLALDLQAILQRERGQHRAAIRTAEQAAAEFPSYGWERLIAASSMSYLGDYSGAMRRVERITHPEGTTTVFPLLGGGARGFAWHHALIADFIAPSGDTTLLRVLADSVEVGGGRSYYGRDWRLPFHIRGMIALRAGRNEEAVAELEKALWTKAAFTRTNVELARAYIAVGRANDAVEILRSAYKTPLDAMARYVPRSELDFWMATAFRAAGATDSSRVYAERVRASWVEADPEIKARLRDLP